MTKMILSLVALPHVDLKVCLCKKFPGAEWTRNKKDDEQKEAPKGSKTADTEKEVDSPSSKQIKN